jgi:Holliday junction resolvase RusA-like endonuclease
MITFTVYGVAQPKGNMRAFAAKGMKFPIVTDSNRSAKSWAQLVAQRASEALEQSPDARVIVGPVRLTVAFFLPRPQRLLIPKWRARQPAHVSAPDTDKLLRSVGDALAQVCYHDDAQVVEILAMKRYTAPEQPPHITVRVEETSGCGVIDAPAAPLPLFVIQSEER